MANNPTPEQVDNLDTQDAFARARQRAYELLAMMPIDEIAALVEEMERKIARGPQD